MTKDEFLKFFDGFKELRTDYGIKKDARLNEKLYPNIKKLHKELQARPSFAEESHALFVGGKNKFTTDDTGGECREPTADDYINMLPDEPMNPAAMSARKKVFEAYSYDTHTKTIPAQRVKHEQAYKHNDAKLKQPGSSRIQSA